MRIDISKLENVKTILKNGVKAVIARCPACAEEDGDHTGDHLIIFPDGRFGCVVHDNTEWSCYEHRSRILKLVGMPSRIPLPRGPAQSRGALLKMTPIEKKSKIVPLRTPRLDESE